MRQSAPLAAHPQLQVHTSPGRIEYRVRNWYVAADGGRRIIRKDSWSLWDTVFVAILAFLSVKVINSQIFLPKVKHDLF